MGDSNCKASVLSTKFLKLSRITGHSDTGEVGDTCGVISEGRGKLEFVITVYNGPAHCQLSSADWESSSLRIHITESAYSMKIHSEIIV